MEIHRLHVVLEGFVQGVGFRYFVLKQARALGLSGEVKNLPDGRVELEAEGTRDRLEELLESVRRGPPASRVAEARPTWSRGTARHQGFRITH